MKIFVTGSRGVPGVPGGIERHCEKLYPIVASKGHEIHIAVRPSYVRRGRRCWRSVFLAFCFAPKSKHFEAAVHTFFSLFKALQVRPDVIHFHAVGPALFIPLAKLLGFRVVFTHHGPDYERGKWGWLARCILRLGERAGVRFADEIIAVSFAIQAKIQSVYGRSSARIANGIDQPQPCAETDFLEKIGVQSKRYILAVARLVPEKGLHDLLEAFIGINTTCKLVIAGGADHNSEYSREILRSAAEHPNILMPGFLMGKALQELYSHARLFVLPSYHEGHPIALLEALSHGLSVVLSDIPAHLEFGLSPDRYFRKGDPLDLRAKMQKWIDQEISADEKERTRVATIEKYDWGKISDQTICIYEKAIRQ